VVDFVKRFKWRLFMFAFLSLAVVVLIAGTICILLPSHRYMTQEIEILLPIRGKDEARIYPSGKKFNRLDIVSPPILKKVYKNNQLEGILSYEDFQKSISVVNFSIDRALLDAEVASKLSKRNLTAADISNIEREYRNALAKIDSSIYRVVFANSSVPPVLSAKILNETILTWFKIYSLLEAEKLPVITVDTQIDATIAQDLKQSRFIALDRLQYYLDQLERLSGRLQLVQSDRKLTASTGESLEDIVSAMRYIKTYQLALLRQMVMADAGLQTSLDPMYVQSRLEHEQRQLNTLKTQHKMLLDSLAIMEKKGVEGSGGGKETEASLMLDSGVLNQLSAIFSRDASNNFRTMLAEQNLALASSIAKQEEAVSFYQEISSKMKKVSENTVTGNSAEFDQLFQGVLKNVINLGKTIAELKQLLTEDYLSSQSFYVPAGEAAWTQDPLISCKKLGGGAVAAWLLLNVIYGGLLFTGNYIGKKPEKK
jgi:hypothetical protein